MFDIASTEFPGDWRVACGGLSILVLLLSCHSVHLLANIFLYNLDEALFITSGRGFLHNFW